MKISGTNVETLNKSGLTKEVYLSQNGMSMNINTTKAGLMICIEHAKIVKNGTVLVLIPKDKKVEEFEELILESRDNINF